MHTNERSRIARELKETANNINEIKNEGLDFDPELNEQFANELTEIESIIGWDSSQPETFVFTRLAEIIEPTCTDLTNGEGYDFACSACGHSSNVYQPNYCPHCRARVVYNNDNA